jgi:hypothetical protein
MAKSRRTNKNPTATATMRMRLWVLTEILIVSTSPQIPSLRQFLGGTLRFQTKWAKKELQFKIVAYIDESRQNHPG